jgi:hypothetical protein
MEHTEVIFESITDKLALTVYHFKGGELVVDMPILYERNARTKLRPAILKDWKIGEVKFDITGYGKYSNSTVTIEVDGKNQIWPFSMIYLDKKP